MATTTTRLMTVAEYEQIPNPPGGRYELHHGELINVGYPKNPHIQAQWQLHQLLQAAAGNAGRAYVEFPYRPLPEHECWGADVAYLPRARWKEIRDWLLGAPDLAVEVLSPSNTAAEIIEKRKLCLDNGSVQFWVVDTDHQLVEVSTPDGHSITYKSGQQIPLFFGGQIAVDEIFA